MMNRKKEPIPRPREVVAETLRALRARAALGDQRAAGAVRVYCGRRGLLGYRATTG